MSRRRIIAAVTAAVLTLVAALVLISYVGGADSRAASKLDPVPVLVVVSPIAKGTAATSLKNAVQVKQLPKSAVAQGAVTSTAQLGTRVADVDLVPGEQVLASRFVDPTSLQAVSIPKGLQEVSVMLTAQRVYGGQAAPGDSVGLFLSTKDPGTTKLVLDHVLVTRVRSTAGTQTTSSGVSSSSQSSTVEDSNVLVTFALGTHDAERVVWAAEHGSIWLSLQNNATDTKGSAVVSQDNFNK